MHTYKITIQYELSKKVRENLFALIIGLGLNEGEINGYMEDVIKHLLGLRLKEEAKKNTNKYIKNYIKSINKNKQQQQHI